MKTIETKVYEFDELTDSAKDNARCWLRTSGFHDEWWDFIYADAENVGLKITAFDLDRNRHAEGKFISSARECAESILKEHGDSCETFKTATAFLKARDEAVDTAPKDDDGEFEDEGALDDKIDDMDAEFLRSILEDFSIILQKQYEYQNEDAQIDEDIRANEYTFTESGKRFG